MVNQAWTTEEIISIARGEAPTGTRDLDFFTDGSSGDSRPIKQGTEMSESELAAYLAWLSSGAVLDRLASSVNGASQMMRQVANGVEGCT